ncbi:MAG: hypothetical protein JXR91_02625 [Deltaproteobacteria bacterium]|nr:hypothetical protein [Deltaproteobacteria bacterium]
MIIENCNDAVLTLEKLTWSGEYNDGYESEKWDKISMLENIIQLRPYTRLTVYVSMVSPSTYHFEASTIIDDSTKSIQYHKSLARTKNVIAKAKAACRKTCNGKWDRFGIMQHEFCMCRTTDAGKECRDGRECESACLWKEWIANKEEIQCNPKPGYLCPRRLPKGTHVGQCAEFFGLFGCTVRIPDGASDNGPVSRYEGVSHICVD